MYLPTCVFRHVFYVYQLSAIENYQIDVCFVNIEMVLSLNSSFDFEGLFT